MSVFIPSYSEISKRAKSMSTSMLRKLYNEAKAGEERCLLYPSQCEEGQEKRYKEKVYIFKNEIDKRRSQ